MALKTSHKTKYICIYDVVLIALPSTKFYIVSCHS